MTRDIEAGVIEEARARQRRHRAPACVAVLVGATTAALLMSGGIGGGGARALTE
jgi:hypothetical protein